jgi:formylglycine-generating enzyme required for sulfatase activity
MPTLFISYKRGTSAVAPLMERLKAEFYHPWFDRAEIHLGDPDWQARIDQGLALCGGVILCITPAACQSEPVRYEVRKARELKKPIFPVILEQVTDYGNAIRELGLPEKQHIEDFTEVTRWDEQIQRLLRNLEVQGLGVTRHDRRQQRDRNNPSYVLHQTYLRRLAERIGMLDLARINPDSAQGVELERVYVDSPTSLSLSVEVRDWHVVDWWISEDQQGRDGSGPGADVQPPDAPRRKPAELGYETAPFEVLVGGIEDAIAEYRREHPDDKPDDEHPWRNPWNNGIKRNRINLHLNHLAAARNRLVVLGAPGSGKSTFVRYLALCLAGGSMDDWTRKAGVASLDNWTYGPLTPVYVELRRLVTSRHFPAGVETPATADHLWAYIQHEVLGDALAGYAEDLRYDLEHGHAALILDGLDEVPYPKGKLKQRQKQLISMAQSLKTRYDSSRIIVASRPYAYEGWTLPGFQAVKITEFQERHRVALASRLYQTAGLDEDAASQKAWALNKQLGRIDRELKDRPLFVTLMATIYLRGDSEGLPTRRGALYRESIRLLLDRWTQSKPDAPSLQSLLGSASPEDLYARLAQLAYEVHKQYGEQPGEPEIPAMLLESHLMKLGRAAGADPVRLYAYLSENAGVLVSPGQDSEKDVFHFAHRTFQEYLAAEHLAGLCQKERSYRTLREHMQTKPQLWREPARLVGDILADNEQPDDLWALIDDTLDALPAPAVVVTPDDPRWWAVWLCSAIVLDHNLRSDGLPRRHKASRDALCDWLARLVETAGALPPPERAECGRALSALGDPRPGVGLLPDGLPDIAWCDIPAGRILYGEKNDPREIAHNFKIAKYPVTFIQFQAFVDSGEYEHESWWRDFPPEYRPQPMAKQYFPFDNHPRDRVSWYQAVAFTRWLTARLQRAGRLAEGLQIRLPTEEEWEYAARGIDGREYPWGNSYRVGHANIDEKEQETGPYSLNQTTAVGLYPQGSSPFGVLDMSGNVWEWCLNDWRNPEIVDGYANEERKVLRGSSFLADHHFDALYRYFELPKNSYSFFGLRLGVFPIRL